MLRHGAPLWMAPGCVCRDSMRDIDLPPNSPADIELLHGPPQRPFKSLVRLPVAAE
jgi:hypothetical protein